MVRCHSPAAPTPDGHRRWTSRDSASESTASRRCVRTATTPVRTRPPQAGHRTAIHAARSQRSLHGGMRSDHAAPPVPADASTTVMDNAEYPCPRECFTIATRTRRNGIRSEIGSLVQRLPRTTTPAATAQLPAQTLRRSHWPPRMCTREAPGTPLPNRQASVVNRVRCRSGGGQCERTYADIGATRSPELAPVAVVRHEAGPGLSPARSQRCENHRGADFVRQARSTSCSCPAFRAQFAQQKMRLSSSTPCPRIRQPQ